MTRASSVLLAGGGTAGHVSPLLSLADTISERDPQVRVTALGTRAGLEARLVPDRGYELLFIPRVPLPRRPSGDLLRLPTRLWSAVAAADRAITASAAEVVVGFGGYVSTPAYLAARRRGIPLVVHEANARPGLANRLGARLTPWVGVAFASTRLPHARVVGLPLRHEIATLDRAARRSEARTHFGLDPRLPTVLVTGGSLGAQRLNDAFSAASEALRANGIQLLHVSGAGKAFTPPPGPVPHVVVPFVDHMELAYAATDLVIARSGANTVCELAALGIPAIFVPLPIGNGEQRLNATDVVAAGGALLVDDAEVDAEWVASVVVPLATDPERLAAMSAAATEAGVRDGADRLLALVDDALAAGVA